MLRGKLLPWNLSLTQSYRTFLRLLMPTMRVDQHTQKTYTLRLSVIADKHCSVLVFFQKTLIAVSLPRTMES